MLMRENVIGLVSVIALALPGTPTAAQTENQSPLVKAKSSHAASKGQKNHSKSAGPVTVTRTIASTEPDAIEKLTKEVVDIAMRKMAHTKPNPQAKIASISGISVSLKFHEDSTTATATVAKGTYR